MLREIYCDAFYQKKIEFNDSLNVVLGSEKGDNSIGKSTFLLVVDFVFGGRTYAISEDIKNNIGPHKICFKFDFGGQAYYFSRSTENYNVVSRCNSDYSVIDNINNNDYCRWLVNMYQFAIEKGDWRDTVGRYIRVYGKQNCDEKRPLNAVPQEKSVTVLSAILKLFDKYSKVEELENAAKQAADKLSIFKKAQEYSYIAQIDSKIYKENKDEIVKLEANEKKLRNDIDLNLADIDEEISEEAINIKKNLSIARRKRSNIQSKLASVNDNLNYKFSTVSNNLGELKQFFPEVRVNHLQEIENFHNKIAKVFHEELTVEKKELEKQLKDCNLVIDKIEKQLVELIHNPNLSKMLLQKHTEILRSLSRMKDENEAYEKLSELKCNKKETEEHYKKVFRSELKAIENEINEEMQTVNNLLYVEQYNPPKLHFTNNSYEFYTINDTGTGVAYKGLVVYDLSIMHLVNLPILVHDSILLKQISDDAIKSILGQYLKCQKQIFIALDKANAYGNIISEILNKYTVLRLEAGGQELFGKSWGKQG